MPPIENSNNEENILKQVSKDSFRINVVCKCGVCPDCVFYDSEKSGSENEKVESAQEKASIISFSFSEPDFSES